MKDISMAVEKHKKFILDTERFIWQHPETGYKEFETSAFMDSLNQSGDRLDYSDESKITVNIG